MKAKAASITKNMHDSMLIIATCMCMADVCVCMCKYTHLHYHGYLLAGLQGGQGHDGLKLQGSGPCRNAVTEILNSPALLAGALSVGCMLCPPAQLRICALTKAHAAASRLGLMLLAPCRL